MTDLLWDSPVTLSVSGSCWGSPMGNSGGLTVSEDRFPIIRKERIDEDAAVLDNHAVSCRARRSRTGREIMDAPCESLGEVRRRVWP